MQTDNVIIIAKDNFGKLIIKTASFIGSPQAIIYYQIAIASSTSLTVVRIIQFTVVICVYVIRSAMSFLLKVIVHKPVFILLSNKG